MDCISGFASSIARDLVCGAVDELHYPCCFDNLVEDLQREKDKLVETRNNVQERINDAKRQTKETAGFVHKWLKEANNDIDNVEELLEKARTKKKSSCFQKFPNWIWRYRVGKQLSDSKRTITKCNEEGSNYSQIERLALLSGFGHLSLERCLMFKSRQYAYDKLMMALKGDEVNMIGLYGMGGCGKTTLAIEVGKRAKEEKLYNQVFFVAVSSTVDVPRIQEAIASSLKFELNEKEEMHRAQRLHDSLIQEEKVLLILDNVWQMLDFEAIGIPSDKNHKGCKVLITTRSKDVCIGMHCQPMIPLETLEDDEAWDLFQKQAHISEATSDDLKLLARQISNECGGLPVAITAVASTLKGKAKVQWDVALDRLKNSKPVRIEKGLQNPYKCLQLSYDNLDIKEAKLLFLLCSVFPEEYEISVEDLTRFAIGLGLIGEVQSFEGARNEVCAAKTKLLSSCLLLDAGEGNCVKMHDLIRQVALCIAEDEGKRIICALEKDVTIEYTLLRYLWCERFPYQLDYSNLEFLCINTYLEVLDEIFEGMKRLRVLFLVNKDFQSKPLAIKSFKSLTNLRCLLLQYWVLGDISVLGDLKKLESITLRRCSFLELPDVIVTQLSNLRLLDLLESNMEKTPFEVIGRHLQLEELYVNDCRREWNLCDKRTAEFFSKVSVPQSLQRYHIQLGTRFGGYRAKLLNRRKTLFLSCFDTSNAAVKDLAKKAEVLLIANIQGGAKNIIPDIFQLDGRGLDELIELWISTAKDIEHLVDTGNHLSHVGTLFSKLRKLTLDCMEHLKSLYHGRPPYGLIEKLEELYIEKCPELLDTLFVWKLNLCNLKVFKLCKCPKLTSLFTPAVAQSLVQLEKLEISGCNGLKQVVADDNKEEINTDDHMLVFPRLEETYIKDCIELHGTLFVRKLNFCSLKVLELRTCSKLTSLFTLAVARSLVHLEKLIILYCDGFKHIIVDDSKDEISRDDHRLVFPELKQLTIRECRKVECIIPVTYAQGLLKLECLVIEFARELKYVFGPCQNGQLDNHQSQNKLRIELPLLEKLTLAYLPNIISICPKNCYPAWPSLRQFTLRDCSEFAIVPINTLMHGSKKTQHDHNNTKTEKTCKLKEVRVIKNHELAGMFQLEGVSIEEEQDPLTMCLEKLSFTCNGLLQSMNLQNLQQMEVNGYREFSTLQNLLDFLFESNQLEDSSEVTSIPSTPLANYNSVSDPINFCNLKRLTLRSCWKLRTLFSPSTAIRLTSLEELMIEDCRELRYLVTYDNAHENKEEIVQKDSESYVSMLPRLERISVKNCKSLEYIFHVSYAQGLMELKEIEIRETRSLIYVFGHNIHDNDDDANSCLQCRNKIQIELPVLRKVELTWIPKMISICPDNYYIKCSSLRQIVMHDVGLSTLSVNNLMVHSDHSTASEIGATSTMNGQSLESVTISNNSNIKGIFLQDDLPINGAQATSRLIDLNLVNLSELNYIWKGAKHSVTLQNLKLLVIRGCEKLKIIFSSSILRSLPQLRMLAIVQCEGLEQIIEDDDEEHESVSNHESKKICFLKLKLLLVAHCNNLKRLFYPSISHEFPELEYLIINYDRHIEQVFEGVRERRVEVLLPELKHVILMQLPNLVDETQFQTVSNLFVYNCPKLSLTSTTTVEDMLRSYYHDREINFFVRRDLLNIRDLIDKESVKQNRMLQTTFQLEMNLKDQTTSGSEHSQIESGATESREVLNKGTQDSTPLELKSSSHDLTEGIKEIETATTGKVPAPVKTTLPTSDSGLTRESTTSLATPLHKIPSRKLVDQQTTGEPSFMDQQNALGETGIGGITKESVQENSASEDATKGTLSASTEGNGFGVVVVTHTEPDGGDMLAQYSQLVEQGDKHNEDEAGTIPRQKIQNVDDSIQEGLNLMDKGQMGVVSNESTEIPPDICGSHSLIIAELGTYKHFVGMDDARIALLEEAILAYPNLWNVCKKFSKRFQVLMLQTLADMLLFLRHESSVSVTPQREKEFHKLCDEAIQLGFERSWVDRMRQRVKVRDCEVDHALEQLSELLKSRNQLCQELLKIEDEINSLNDFIASQNTCFDFL